MNCICKDWQENIDILNAPYTLNLTAVEQYKGKSFKYCPWCGKELIIKQETFFGEHIKEAVDILKGRFE